MNSYYNDEGKRQDLYEQLWSYIVPSSGQISINIAQDDLNNLNECLTASKILRDYYNNGLCNYISIPDRDSYDLYYAESVDEYGEIEQEEQMTWYEYYSETLNVENGYDFDVLYKVMGKLEDNNCSTEVFTDEIEMLLNDNLTQYLEKSEAVIKEIGKLTEKMIEDDNKLLKILGLNINYSELSNIDRFSYITGFALRKNEKANEYLNSECNNDEKLHIRQNMLHKNMNNISSDIISYLDTKNNPYNVNEEYKLHNYRVDKFFNELSGNYISTELRKKFIEIDEVYSYLSVGEPIGEGYGQIINLLSKEKGSEVTLNEINAMDIKTLELAKEIITENILEKTNDVELRLHDIIYNRYDRTPTEIERQMDKFLINYYDNWIITKTPTEKLSKIIDSCNDRNWDAINLICDIFEGKQLSDFFKEVQNDNKGEIIELTAKYNELSSTILKENFYFIENYPNIDNKIKDKLLNDLPYLKHDIINDLNVSASTYQILNLLNSNKNEIGIDDIYLLDKKEQVVLHKIASATGMSINSKEIKGTFFEETLGNLPATQKAISKSKNKVSEMDM